MEASLVPRAGIEFQAIPAAGLHGVNLTSLPGNILQLIRGWRQAGNVLERFEPDVLFFTGGYMGIPVALAGRKIPSVMYVPDIEPALALKWIGKWVDIIAVSVDASRTYFPTDKRVEVTGYPIRQELADVEKAGARRFFGLSEELPVILIFGGSRGARSLNQAAWTILSKLLEKTQILHVTGKLDWPQVEAVRCGLFAEQAARYHPYPYLHEEMAQALGAADLVISRAGAATIGEYPHFSLPAVLVPYPHAWRYQKVNADYLTAHGAAVMVSDEALKEDLLPVVEDLLSDPNRMTEMGQAAAMLSRGNAAVRIADLIREAAGRGGSRG